MKKFIRNAVLVIIGLFLLFLLLTGGNLLFFWSIFNWIQGGVRGITGLDVQLSKALAALLLAVLVMLPFGRMALAFTPLPEKKKSLYRALVFGGIAVFFLFAYLASKNTFFDPETGKPVKYYSQLPNGEYKFYSEPGFDPFTGDSLKKVTPEVSMKSNGFWPEKNSPFDPETGEAIQYYSQLPNGEYKFYLQPGFDPLTGEPVKKVTREIILKSKGLWPTEDYDFDPKTGEPLKYYSQWPDGQYKFYSGPGYDPVTGDVLKKVSREVVLKSKGLWPTEVPASEPPKEKAIDKRYKENQDISAETQAPQPSTVPKQEEITAPTTLKNNEEPPTVSRSYPLKGKVRFYNETSFAFKIYNSSERLVLTVRPHEIRRVLLAAGEYYQQGGGRTRKFTVKEGELVRVNSFNIN